MSFPHTIARPVAQRTAKATKQKVWLVRLSGIDLGASDHYILAIGKEVIATFVIGKDSLIHDQTVILSADRTAAEAIAEQLARVLGTGDLEVTSIMGSDIMAYAEDHEVNPDSVDLLDVALWVDRLMDAQPNLDSQKAEDEVIEERDSSIPEPDFLNEEYAEQYKTGAIVPYSYPEQNDEPREPRIGGKKAVEHLARASDIFLLHTMSYSELTQVMAIRGRSVDRVAMNTVAEAIEDEIDKTANRLTEEIRDAITDKIRNPLNLSRTASDDELSEEEIIDQTSSFKVLADLKRDDNYFSVWAFTLTQACEYLKRGGYAVSESNLEKVRNYSLSRFSRFVDLIGSAIQKYATGF